MHQGVHAEGLALAVNLTLAWEWLHRFELLKQGIGLNTTGKHLQAPLHISFSDLK